MTRVLGEYGVQGMPVLAAVRVAADHCSRVEWDRTMLASRRVRADAGPGDREAAETAAVADLWLDMAAEQAAPVEKPTVEWAGPRSDPIAPGTAWMVVTAAAPVRALP
jgi:hypothetical protein